MKKPIVAHSTTSRPQAKLIFKLHKENIPSLSKMQAIDPLQLVRTAAEQQQIRVAQLIQ